MHLFHTWNTSVFPRIKSHIFVFFASEGIKKRDTHAQYARLCKYTLVNHCTFHGLYFDFSLLCQRKVPLWIWQMISSALFFRISIWFFLPALIGVIGVYTPWCISWIKLMPKFFDLNLFVSCWQHFGRICSQNFQLLLE